MNRNLNDICRLYPRIKCQLPCHYAVMTTASRRRAAAAHTLWCRRYPMTELENDDEWCLRFIICPRCLCDAIKRWRPPLALARELRKRILWLHSVICWAESTFYLSLSMGRWVVNSTTSCASCTRRRGGARLLYSRWLIAAKASLDCTWPWRQWQWAFTCSLMTGKTKTQIFRYAKKSVLHLLSWTF